MPVRKAHSKRYRALVPENRRGYTIDAAVAAVKAGANATFDETVDIAFRLGIDPKKQDQTVRGTAVLPHGTGKKIRVVVVTRGDKEKEALDAGADYVGFADILEKIKGGWFDFDTIVATPDSMPELGKLGKLLGTRGLMPSPKTGTVTPDVAGAVRSLKAGRINFKADKAGNVHAIVGKASFAAEQLAANIRELVAEVQKLRPSSLRGQYLKSVTVSSTMGPGYRLDPRELAETVRKGD